MISSARNDMFKFEFPRLFMPEEISKKWKPYLDRIGGSLLTEPIDIINYGIQGLNIPGISFEPEVQFDNRGISTYVRTSKQPRELITEKSFTVKCQAMDGWVNYWMLLDCFHYYYKIDKAFLPAFPGIQFLNGEGYVMFTIEPKDCMLSSISDLDLDYSSNSLEFQTFEIKISYNRLETSLTTNN